MVVQDPTMAQLLQARQQGRLPRHSSCRGLDRDGHKLTIQLTATDVLPPIAPASEGTRGGQARSTHGGDGRTPLKRPTALLPYVQLSWLPWLPLPGVAAALCIGRDRNGTGADCGWHQGGGDKGGAVQRHWRSIWKALMWESVLHAPAPGAHDPGMHMLVSGKHPGLPTQRTTANCQLSTAWRGTWEAAVEE